MSAPVRDAPHQAKWFRTADYETIWDQLASVRSTSPWHDVKTRLWAQPAARRASWFLVVLALLSFLAPLLPLPSPAKLRLQQDMQPPTFVLGTRTFDADYWHLSVVDQVMVSTRRALFGKFETGHWLGTDSKGRDTLARILWGSRTSLLVALCAALTSLSIGVLWGSIAGLVGGRLDNLMMRIVDVLQSVPTIFVVIFLLSFLNAPRASLADEPLLSREQVFFLVIGAVSWLSTARVVRGQVLGLRSTAYVEAARVQGASTWWIVRKHVWPNILSVAIVYVTLTLPSVILYEAFLSFLGLGVEPPKVSWGLLASDAVEAISPLASAWWLVVWPALVMALTLLALGALGDALRDALDLKGGADR